MPLTLLRLTKPTGDPKVTSKVYSVFVRLDTTTMKDYIPKPQGDYLVVEHDGVNDNIQSFHFKREDAFEVARSLHNQAWKASRNVP